MSHSCWNKLTHVKVSYPQRWQVFHSAPNAEANREMPPGCLCVLNAMLIKEPRQARQIIHGCIEGRVTAQLFGGLPGSLANVPWQCQTGAFYVGERLEL